MSESWNLAGRRRVPLPMIALACLGAIFFVLPLLALALRAPWSDGWSLVTSRAALEPILLSFLVAAVAVVFAATVGLPLAWLLARGAFPGRRVLRALVTVPMVLPPVVAGLGLVHALGDEGLLGGALDAFGVRLSLTTAGAIVAAAFVSAPFLVLSLEAGFANVDRDLEDAARTLGAGEARIFTTITLPALRPAFAAGGSLAFTRALGEFGATITFAGNLRGRTQTAPLAVFEFFQSDPGAALMLSLVMLCTSFLLILLLRAHLEER